MNRRAAIPAVVGLLLLGCGAQRSEEVPVPPAPRLVLLYAPCSVNAGYLSPYDSAVDFTPRVQELAERGTVFRRHYTEAGQSGIAYAALFSGAQAMKHGVFSHPDRLSDSVFLMSEAFAESGFETFAWDGHPMAKAADNYFQGVPTDHSYGQPLVGSAAAFQDVLRRVATEPDLKVFIATTLLVNHVPYSQRYLTDFCRAHTARCADWKDRQTELTRYADLLRAHFKEFGRGYRSTVAALRLSDSEARDLAAVAELLYESTIFELDRLFGAVVDQIRDAGLWSESLVVWTADHGETLFRPHGLFQWTHGWELTTEDLRVPWIIGGGAAAGLLPSFDSVSRSIDVFPTVAALAGVRGPQASDDRETEGVDLSKVLRGAAPPPALVAFSHTVVKPKAVLDKEDPATLWMSLHAEAWRGQMWVSMVEGHRHFKFRNLDGQHWGFELFDLATDPAEENDRFDARDPQHRDAARRLVEYQRRLRRAWMSTLTEAQAIDGGVMDQLRSLGYAR